MLLHQSAGQTFCHPGTHLHTIFVFSDAFDKHTFDIIGCKAWILKAFKEDIFKLRCINNIQATQPNLISVTQGHFNYRLSGASS
jgi:hypothetical protein